MICCVASLQRHEAECGRHPRLAMWAWGLSPPPRGLTQPVQAAHVALPQGTCVGLLGPGLLSNNKASTLVFSLFESKRFISYS